MRTDSKGQVVMLDTSFLIRLMKENDPLHNSALEYYQYLLEHGFILYVSTIALAEYCVKGKLSDIPFDNLRIVPFNLDHSSIAGAFASSLFKARNRGEYGPNNRLVIANDTKLFAQAARLNAVYFLTADTKSEKAMNVLANTNQFEVKHLDIHKSVSEQFGTLF